ncbi:MAG TPA: serine/threonine-protein kinase [Vicinamibacterales bacterium]|nr:serine/threonine-protein kinase [Vicinamibacterales bacterium]
MANRPDDELTIGVTRDVTRAGSGSSPSDSSDTRRPPSSQSVSGSIIAGRYRLVSLLGRGGMGEVYRADDLTLDQPVALKFLPEDAALDSSRLAQFHNELRVARQVSHKNVCRLYDVGESEGRRFLTMQYVDGEDLASLLRRIGRVPHDKAIQIARQLCAGLAAAHERGVVHRDLKPANVMIDGEGNALITDFGLAVATGDATRGLAGTPRYMAPEQLRGEPATLKSDIYALGLVLYELFTGHRARDDYSIEALRHGDTSTETIAPSSRMRDIDPGVERVIMRCLEADAARRPGSALSVAAALPGGDPLAAALAAGETPSPEMLAAAGEAEALPVARGLAWLACIGAGLVVAAIAAPAATEARLVPLDRPPLLLADRAQQVLASLGYDSTGGDAAYGFRLAGGYRSWVARRKVRDTWSILRSEHPPGVQFWYRASPSLMTPTGVQRSYVDPPFTRPDAQRLILDTRGQLVEFQAVPPVVDPIHTPAADIRWDQLFELAGLRQASFRAVSPQWTPPSYADTRAAWEGTMPDQQDVSVRIEAAAYRGLPVAFTIVWPWTQTGREGPFVRSRTDRIAGAIFIVLGVALLAVAGIVARRHLSAGRGDVRGATRLALFVVGGFALAWLVATDHVADVAVERASLRRALEYATLLAALMWIIYIALEPFARKFWPDLMLGWSRLLSGRLYDARIGRDVLAGLGLGVIWLLLNLARYVLPPVFGYPAPSPRLGGAVSTLLGVRETVQLWLVSTLNELVPVLLLAFLFVALRWITRRTALTIAIATPILFVYWSAFGDASAFWLEFTLELAIVALFAFALIRFGLLTALIATVVFRIGAAIPLTTDVGHWSATPSTWTIAAAIAIACFGYYASRAGQPLFGRLLPGD